MCLPWTFSLANHKKEGACRMFFSFSLLPFLRRSLFGISSEETTFARRGFSRGDSRTQGILEHIGALFVEGYHLALADDRMEVLVPALEELEAAYRGFAFEGAAMALSLLDAWQTSTQSSGTDEAV